MAASPGAVSSAPQSDTVTKFAEEAEEAEEAVTGGLLARWRKEGQPGSG
jgi:hypothetical protein